MGAALVFVVLAAAVAVPSNGELLSPQQRFQAARLKASVSLTDKSFGVITGDGFWVIKFFAPWCSHCIKLEPEWNRFAKELDADLNINVGEVNCVDQKRLPSAFGIEGYPTILMYHNRQAWAYTGKRSADDLLAYFQENPPTSWLSKPLLLRIPDDSPFLELRPPSERALLEEADKAKEIENPDPADVQLAKKTLPVRLSPVSFLETVKKGTWTVRICSTFISECQKNVPEWINAVAELKALYGTAMSFGEIEASEDFIQQYHIQRLPSFFLFREGKMYRYRDDPANIASYVERDWAEDIYDEIPSFQDYPETLTKSTFIRFLVVLSGIGGAAYIISVLVAWSNKSKSL